MAGATQHRSRGSITKVPSASSDDGTLADTPLADTPMSGENIQQHNQVTQFGTFAADAVAQQLTKL